MEAFVLLKVEMQELIKGLRGELINCGCHASSGNECCCDCTWPEHVASKAADLIEAQAAEIGVLKIAHEAHQTNNLKMLAVLKKQAAEIEKYKALCDQMGNALEWYCRQNEDPESRGILEAWRVMK